MDLRSEHPRRMLVPNSCHLTSAHIVSYCFPFLPSSSTQSRQAFDCLKRSLPPVAMLCGKTLRCLIVFVWALAAVSAASQGLQASAALTPTQTRGPTCNDFPGTADDVKLRRKRVKKFPGICYCNLSPPFPSKECGESRALKNRWGGQVSGFSP